MAFRRRSAFRSRRSRRSSKSTRIMRTIGSNHFSKSSSELKCIDINFATLPAIAAGANSLTDYSTSATGSNLVNAIQLGSAAYNRIGRKVRMVSLRLIGAVYNSTANIATQNMRLMVIYDSQPNGALPLVSDILSGVDQAATAINTAYVAGNLNNKNRFTFLMDKLMMTTANGTGVQTSFPHAHEVYIERFLKLNGLLSTFNSSSSPATIGNISTGALYVLLLGAAGGVFSGTARLRFTD